MDEIKAEMKAELSVGMKAVCWVDFLVALMVELLVDCWAVGTVETRAAQMVESMDWSMAVLMAAY